MNTSEKSRFLLLFRNKADAPDPSPEEMEKTFAKWMDWMKSMKAKGQFLVGEPLDDKGAKVLKGPGEWTVIDGPFAEAKEVVSGYIIIAAGDLSEATAIAKGCPGIEHGTIVEVRTIEKLPSI